MEFPAFIMTIKNILRTSLLVAVTLTALFASSVRAADDGQWGPHFTIRENRLEIPAVGPDNPVIYDNDWWYDIIDAGFCVAQHKLGNLDLRGLIVTRDMWPDPPYTWEASAKEFNEFRDLAEQSGLNTIPELTVGARRPLQRPAAARLQKLSSSAPREAS